MALPVFAKSNYTARGWRNRVVTIGRKQWPRFVLLACLGFLVRLPALTGQLVWDDAYLARDNPFIKSPVLALEAFRHYLFLDSFSPHYRPVQNLSFMLDYYFWNTDVSGFHLTNILLHVASGLLLYRLLSLLFCNGAGIWKSSDGQSDGIASLTAFLIAAVWIVHPVHSAAIDYISGRADSLAFLFSAGAWLLVLKGRSLSQLWAKVTLYSLAAICSLLAFCSREIAGVWIFLFLVHTIAFASGITRRTKIVTVICCLVVLAAYAGLHQLPGPRAETNANDNFGGPVRATLMLRALGDYGRLVILPSNLHMERTVFELNNYRTAHRWRESIGSEYLSILGLCTFALFAFGAIKKGSGQRMRIIGAVWFFAGYLPVSNIVPLNATVAEHWLYLPSVGFLIFLAGCAFDCPRKVGHAFAAIAGCAILAFGIRSTVRSSDWRDEETFYQRTVAAGGVSPRVVVNLAQIYARTGRVAEAEKMLCANIAAAPDYPNARNTLASLLAWEGRTAEAETVFSVSVRQAREARKEYPRTWAAACNFARMRVAAHDEAAAIAILERARADYPQVWDLISLESELIRRTQGPQPALHLVEQFAQANWWHYAAALAEGKLYAENNDGARALQALHRAALLDVHDTQALNLIARICLRQNRIDEAIRTQRRAIARQPDDPRQYLLFSEILDGAGRTADADLARAKVSQLQALAMAASSRG